MICFKFFGEFMNPKLIILSPLAWKTMGSDSFDPDLSRLYETFIDHRVSYNTDLIDVKL